jgi:transcription termination factor Rho
VNASSTRREELLFDAKSLQAVWRLRRVLSGLQQDGTSAAALDLLMDRVKKTKNNAEFLADVATGPSPTA